MNPYRAGPVVRRTVVIASPLAAIVALILLPSVAIAQVAPPTTQNLSVFAVLLPGVIALSTQITTAVRDALTSSVPPVGVAVNPKLRPWLAAFVGAVVAFLASLSAAVATGGDPASRPMVLSACVAAMANLGITLPKLIYSEANASAVASNTSAVERVAEKAAAQIDVK